MKKRLLVLSVMFTAVIGVSTASASMGMGFDIRSMGMGGAFVAVADDINAVDINPAGLAFVKDRQVEYVHLSKNASDIRHSINGLEYVSPIGNGTLGVSLTRQSYDEGSSSSVYGLAYGTKLNGNLAVGVHLYKDDSSTNLAVSALYKDNSKMSYGLVVGDSNTTPGVAYRPDDKTVVALDFGDNTNIGVERQLGKKWAVRVGSDAGEVAYGVGYKIQSDLRIDYAHESGLNGVAVVKTF